MPNISPEVTSEQTKSYRFTPLNEHVSNDDLLKSAPHRAVSDSLHQLITENEKAISIGLEGRWGSGKSTVIDLLRKKLTESDSTENVFFVFDTWAHEGDALRKSFLEEFAAQAAKNAKGRAKTQIEDTTNEALGKKRTRKVHSTKTISNYGVGMGLSLLLVPMGASLFSKANIKENVLSWHGLDGSVDGLLALALILSFFPMIFSLLYWLWQTVVNDKANANWQWFNPNSQETITQNISDDKDRTSFEFQRYFKNILKQLNTGSGNRKKVVIVIDNLDRVEPDYAKAVWKTLQTFFQHRSSNDADQNSMMDKVWFIVPYDREGLAAIWENDVLPVSLVSVRTGEETMFPASQTALTSEVPKAKPDVVKSFVEKSFQLVAEVPMPVSSDRHELITQYAEAAFSAWPALKRKELIELIRQRFDAEQYQSSGSQPTPRQIKSLLNKIGFLAMQWGERFSVGAYLYFAAEKSGKTQQQFLDDVVSAAFPTHRDSQPVLASHFVEELAGLLFGVEKEIGMQMLMKEMIPTALKRGDGELLRRLRDLHPVVFIDVWKTADNQTDAPIWRLRRSLSSDNRYQGVIPLEHEGLGSTERAISALVEGFRKDLDKSNNETLSFRDSEILSFSVEKFIFHLPDLFDRSGNCVLILDELFRLKNFRSSLKSAFLRGIGDVIAYFLSERNSEQPDEKRVSEKRDLINYVSLNVRDTGLYKRGALVDQQWFLWVEYCSGHSVNPWLVEPLRPGIAYLLKRLNVNVGIVTNVDEIDFGASSIQIPGNIEDQVEEAISLSFQNAPAYYQILLLRLLTYLVVSDYLDASFLQRPSVEKAPVNIFSITQFNGQAYVAVLFAVIFGTKLNETSVSGDIKNIWKNKDIEFDINGDIKGSDHISTAIFKELKLLKKLSVLEELSKDPLYERAALIIRDNPEFFSDLNNSTNQAVTMESGE